MKLIFKNKVTQEKMEQELPKITKQTIETEYGLETIKTYEFKKEILRTTDSGQNLVDYIRNIETNADTGTFVKAKDTTVVLQDYTSKTAQLSSQREKNKLTDFYKSFSYEKNGYILVFEAPTSTLDDNKTIQEDLFNVAHDIVKNTENNIVYDNILKEPLKDVEITTEKTGEQLRKELKEFCSSVKIKQKKVYMTFNLFSDLEMLSKKLDTPLITDNPNVLGGKLLVGIPIVAFEEDVLKQYNQKEIIICGDLYNSFTLVKNIGYEFDFTTGANFGYTSFRIIQDYDFKKTDDRISVGQITGIETILNKI